MGAVDLDGYGKPDLVVGGWGTQARLLLTGIEKYRAAQPALPQLKPAKPAE